MGQSEIKNQEQNEILISILSSYVCEKKITINYNNVDWNYITNLAIKQGLACLLYKATENIVSLDEDVRTKLEYYYNKALFATASRNETLKRVSALFEEIEIDFIILKGAVIQGYYPSPELRVMSDLDFYIHDTDREKVKKALLTLNISFSKTNSYQDIYLDSNGVIIEVHHALWGYGFENTKTYKNIWDTSHRLKGKEHTYILSEDGLYIFTISHMLKHFTSSGIGIRPLFDIWFILKKNITSLDFAFIKSELLLFNAVEFEKKIRSLLNHIFLGKEKTNDIDLIEKYLLRCNTHGSIDVTSVNALGDDSKSIHVIKRLFPPLSVMKRRFALLSKYPFFLPFFWLIRIFSLPFQKDKAKNNLLKIKKADSKTKKYVENVFKAAGIQKNDKKSNKNFIYFLLVIIFLIIIFCSIFFQKDLVKISDNHSKIEVSHDENSIASSFESESDILNDYGTISWKGGRYTGYLKNNIPNGSGEHIVENSFRYVGFFVNGSYEGRGKIEYFDNSYYEGDFKNNLANGNGTLYCANGDIINGVFSDGNPNGFCNYEYSDGNLFIGTMINGLKHGEGTFYWLNGDKYVGSFSNDRRDGYGILYYSNGDVYTGNWSQGFCNGFGTYVFADGHKYEGRFDAGIMNDENCTIYYPDGSIYVGSIIDGIQNGKGQITYKNGDIAKGNFSSGYLSGEADFFFSEKKLWVKVIYEKGKIIKYIID